MQAIVRRAGTVALGTAGVQLVQLASTPILTRLYSMAAFDAFAVYASVVAVLAASSSFRLAHAIVTEKEEESAWRIAVSCLVMAVGLGVAVGVGLIVVSQTPLWTRWDMARGGALWLAVPFGVATAGVLEVLTFWSNRRAEYRTMTQARMLAAVATAVLGVALNFWSVGLVFAALAGQVAGVLFLVYRPQVRERLRTTVRWWNSESLRVHRRFVLFAWPADLLNVITTQLPTLALNRYAPTGAAGQYNLTNRVLGVPLQFISSSMAEVFRQHASEDFHRTGSCRQLYWRTVAMLAAVAVLPTVILFFFSPVLFGIVFGARWIEAGAYVRILLPMFFLRFCISPVSYVVFLANRQYLSLVLDLYNGLSLGLWVFLLSRGQLTFAEMLQAFVASYSVSYIATLLLGHWCAKNERFVLPR
ncbi:MAG: lipopolysaccharide biosynthesis protein [Archangium sp.]